MIKVITLLHGTHRFATLTCTIINTTGNREQEIASKKILYKFSWPISELQEELTKFLNKEIHMSIDVLKKSATKNIRISSKNTRSKSGTEDKSTYLRDLLKHNKPAAGSSAASAKKVSTFSLRSNNQNSSQLNNTPKDNKDNINNLTSRAAKIRELYKILDKLNDEQRQFLQNSKTKSN